MVSSDFNKTPVKPVLNGENIYEEMPVCFNPQELGYANVYDVWKAAYLSVFAGACGNTHGCGPVNWFSRRGGDFFSAFHSWNTALDLPAANEMKYLRKLMESWPMLERIPDLVLLAEDPSCASERIQATRGKNYAFSYSAYGRPIRVRMNEFNESKITASWYDPLTGKSSRIGEFKNTGCNRLHHPCLSILHCPHKEQTGC